MTSLCDKHTTGVNEAVGNCWLLIGQLWANHLLPLLCAKTTRKIM